jgi:hypothetical protein
MPSLSRREKPSAGGEGSEAGPATSEDQGSNAAALEDLQSEAEGSDTPVLDMAGVKVPKSKKPQEMWRELVLEPAIQKIIEAYKNGKATYYALMLYAAGTLYDKAFMYRGDVSRQWSVRKEDDLDWRYFDDVVDGLTKKEVANKSSMEALATKIAEEGEKIGKGFDYINYAKYWHSPGAGHMLDYLRRQGFLSVGYAYGVRKT